MKPKGRVVDLHVSAYLQFVINFRMGLNKTQSPEYFDERNGPTTDPILE